MLIGKPGGNSGRHRARAPMAEINIIPLVDVMLVLLIIFMVTTAFVKDSGLNLKLPPAKTTESGAQSSDDLLIAMGQNDQITLNGRPATESQVEAAMRRQVQRSPQTRVTIKGDGRIAYARIVRMMDLARQSGLKSVSLGTRLPEAVQ